MSAIPYGKHNISDDDINSVIDVLRSEYLTQGPVLPEFEKKVAHYSGAKHAVATNSATSALHIACLALGLSEGDILWTTPITFVATANCARYCRATVDFVDIDPGSYNISIKSLAEKLEKAKSTNALPKVVVPVHLSGQPCDMESIHALSKRYGFYVIEDASHAIGATYKKEKVGNCRYSDITIFSFHPVKIVTTGEGGMALTNNIEYAKRMARLRSHGITRYAKEMTHHPDGPWYYEQIDLGYNYRMTDFQAALGISQMKRLDEFIKERHAIADRYDLLLNGVDIITPSRNKASHSSMHLYIIRVPSEKHLLFFEKLRASGVLVNLHYIPVYRQPYYANMGFNFQDYPEAELYYKEAISLPIYPGLSNDQQSRIVDILKNPVGYQTIF